MWFWGLFIDFSIIQYKEMNFKGRQGKVVRQEILEKRKKMLDILKSCAIIQKS